MAASTTKQNNKGKNIFVNLFVTLVFAFIYFYIKLPAINLHSGSFYSFFLITSAVYCFMAIITSEVYKEKESGRTYWQLLKNSCVLPLIIIVIVLLIYLIGGLLSSVIIRSNEYSNLMTVEVGNFSEDIDEVSFDQIPLLDKASSEKLGDRKLGELSDMVSQFEVTNEYTQINYKGRPVRVTTLEYGDWFKWINNMRSGIPAYLIIDMVTQEVEVVRPDDGMKYTKADHFGRNLYRHLRFNYPTFIFDTPTFEIDENGTPYYVCSRIVKRIGLFGGEDIQGAVLVNTISGECEYFESIPKWVDGVYSARVIMNQYDYHGVYQNGFLNSLFGQKNCTKTTDGYNYIAMDDDVYVYTGITSVGSDESNIGFILTNQRTKQTTYYEIAGAEEYSAMSSAEGVVQHLNYTSTFPLLLNINKQPTYFMALKDYAGLVKMYAMVNVQQYQIVSTGATVEECRKNYQNLLIQNKISSNYDETIIDNQNAIFGQISRIDTAIVNGYTEFYFILDENADQVFMMSINDNPNILYYAIGDMVEINYINSKYDKFYDIMSIK